MIAAFADPSGRPSTANHMSMSFKFNLVPAGLPAALVMVACCAFGCKTGGTGQPDGGGKVGGRPASGDRWQDGPYAGEKYSGVEMYNEEALAEYSDAKKSAEKQKQYELFVETRALKLGKALVDIGLKDEDLRILGWRTIKSYQEQDAETLRRCKLEKRPVSGVIIPRYIAAELAKPEAQRNIDWLAQQGRLLRAAHNFETETLEGWKTGVTEILIEGGEGRKFLVAQMIKRLAMAEGNFVELAQQILAEYVAEEAITPLVDVAHLSIGGQPGIFASRVAGALALIGPRASTEMLRVFKDAKGNYLAASDANWRTRRDIAPAFARMKYGVDQEQQRLDVAAILARDLVEARFKSDNTRFIYHQVLVETLGDLGDSRAAPAIAAAWRADPEFLAPMARKALFKLTGEMHDTPPKA